MKDIENVHSPSAIMKHLPRVWAPYWLLAYTNLNNLCINLEIQVVLNWVNVNVGFLHFKVSLFPLLKAVFQSGLKPATIDARSTQHRCLTQKGAPMCPFLCCYQFGCFFKPWPSKNPICGHQLHLGQLVEKSQSLKASFDQGERLPSLPYDCAHLSLADPQSCWVVW